MMEVAAQKSFKGTDTAEQMRKLRQSVGPDRKIAVFLDNASIHTCKVVRDVCEEWNEDIKLLYNVTYRPDLNGIEHVWQLAKQHYRKKIANLKINGQPIDNQSVVHDCLNLVSSETTKQIASRGWKSLQNAKPKQPNPADQSANQREEAKDNIRHEVGISERQMQNLIKQTPAHMSNAAEVLFDQSD